MQQQPVYIPHKKPNILVTGTPGTGKTTLAQLLNQSLSFIYLNIGLLIKQNKLYDQWDDQLDVPIFDQQLLLQFIQKNYPVHEGGLIIDFHSPSVFPSHWIDFVLIMRCNNQILYKRLEERKYTQKKINQNIQCQIFQQIKLDVDDQFYDRLDSVMELVNQNQQHMQINIDKAIQWLVKYKENLENN